MSCRKKTGWRGPSSLAVSAAASRGALAESATALGACARLGPDVIASAASPMAAAPAPIVMSTGFRIILTSQTPTRSCRCRRTVAGRERSARSTLVYERRQVGRARPRAGGSIVSTEEAPQRDRRAPHAPLHRPPPPHRGGRADPLCLPSHQGKKTMHVATVTERNPAPFHRTGALSLPNRLAHDLGQPRGS